MLEHYAARKTISVSTLLEHETRIFNSPDRRAPGPSVRRAP
jgi:hypothetical protein